MGAVAAHRRAEVERVSALGQEFQIRAVGVVHEQRRIVLLADGGKSRDIRHIAQIIRAGDVHGGGRHGQCTQRVFQPFRPDLAGAKARPLLRPQPDDLRVAERGGVDERLVDVPRGHDGRSGAGQQREVHHCANALAAALRGIERRAAAEDGGGVLFAGFDQAVRPGDLGDVERLAAEKRLSLMPRHMEPQRVRRGVVLDEIANGSVHPYVSAAFIMMAHSMRFRNSSQPGS